MSSQRSGSSSPLSGDYYHSETAGASWWSPHTLAHGRRPWTSCRRRFTSERRSSRLTTAERVGPRQEARLVCSALRQYKVLLRILPASRSALCLLTFAPHLPEQTSKPPLSPASLGLPRDLPDMQPHLSFATIRVSGVFPWHAYWI